MSVDVAVENSVLESSLGLSTLEGGTEKAMGGRSASEELKNWKSEELKI